VLDGDKSLEASFGGALLNVTAGQGGGVTLDPPGPTYPLGSVVTLTANPDPGSPAGGAPSADPSTRPRSS
jgi:hypothetical protein